MDNLPTFTNESTVDKAESLGRVGKSIAEQINLKYCYQMISGIKVSPKKKRNYKF